MVNVHISILVSGMAHALARLLVFSSLGKEFLGSFFYFLF
jgi:hypothetical protein